MSTNTLHRIAECFPEKSVGVGMNRSAGDECQAVFLEHAATMISHSADRFVSNKENGTDCVVSVTYKIASHSFASG